MLHPSVKKASKRIVGYPDHNVPNVTTKDWLNGIWTDPFLHVKKYFLGLFPILTWINQYNVGWWCGDAIAGVTVGIVAVPQAMSFAQVAGLPPEYGLYSSIFGAFIYCVFATSKDVSLGPTAVLSLTVGSVVNYVQEKHPGEWDNLTIATTISLTLGFVVLALGLLRIGWLVEFIPLPAISGFMTGSAITIVAGQVPGLMGISRINTQVPTYKLVINTLQDLPRTKLDAAWGVTGLFVLCVIKAACTWATKRWPQRSRLFFVVNVLRNAIVLLALTVAAWLHCRSRVDSRGDFPIKLLKDIPPGLRHIGLPRLQGALVSALAARLPVTIIIALLEHISIAKSFGRMNGYKVDPNQELVSIGVANTVGTCFGAYPVTGSFTRSALQYKSGACTPLSGIFTSVVVIVALYGLTKAFFWIPNAVLCAVIIHSVADLIASPSEVFRYWLLSPPEFFIWLATVFVIVFMSIENGVYVSIGASLALLLFRIAHPHGSFMGKVFLESGQEKEPREIFVPIRENGVTDLEVIPPAPGIVVYRFEESYLYPNCYIVNSALVDYVKKNTRRGKNLSTLRLRPWNDSVPRCTLGMDAEKVPWLHAIVLDFSSISQLDSTATQALVDTRAEIERWTGYSVEFHFATILSPWIRRALVAGGFGIGPPCPETASGIAAANSSGDVSQSGQSPNDIETGIKTEARHEKFKSWQSLLYQKTPFFHPDLTSAVAAAESGLDRVIKFDEKERPEELSTSSSSSGP